MNNNLDDIYEIAEAVLKCALRHGDYTKAVELAYHGYKCGDPRFANMLGYFHEHGHGVNKNSSAALHYYRQAANKGFPIAQYNVAIILSNNEQNDEAIELWSQAASAGDTPSMIMLGRAYEYGLGVEQDVNNAISWYQRASEAKSSEGGMELIRCLRELGQMKEVYEKRHLIYDECKKRNAEAWLEAALLFKENDCREQDIHNIAFICYEQSALLGSAAAQEWCGEMYAMGRCGCQKNVERGIGFLKLAAKANMPRAKYVLACLYAMGDGVKQDSVAAYRLAREAAECGVTSAQLMVSKMLENGDGVKSNHPEARKWLEIARAVQKE